MNRALDLLLDGLYFGESPRWHDGRLWFSDFFDHQVKAVDSRGSVEVIVEVANQPSGLGWLPDGRLLVVSMLDRTLMRLDDEGLVLHADLSGIATFHTNDMVVDGAGRAYVGNFGFDLDHAFATRGADTFANHDTAVMARVDPDGSVHAVADDLHFPNGTVITPSGHTLIVAETMANRLTAFDIAPDGSLCGRRVWADLGRRLPDGICLDADGNVWLANPAGSECVLVAEGGEVLDVITTEQPCLACMLGGENGRTLHLVTCSTSVASVAAAARTGSIVTMQVDVPGAGRP